MSDQSRAIIHLDLDAFFAAVEILQRPELAGKPVIVGGLPAQRGVVASASYAARAFGVHSAMPMVRALALCPDAVVLRPRHGVYGEYSRRVMDILRRVTPLVEPMSIDEAYLDVTDHTPPWETAVELARQLQQQVQTEVQLSASLGVATNKLVAKVASDRDKPGGLTVVPPGNEAAFLAPLPVRVLQGVGPVMARKLGEMGLTTVGQLARVPEGDLILRFGQWGALLAQQAQGIDDRPVVTEHETKSISQEHTFPRDVSDKETLQRKLRELSQGVAEELKGSDLAAGTIALKLRYADFSTLTRQMRLTVPTADGELIYQAVLTLLPRAWQSGRAVRLLGVAARSLSPPAGQLPLL
jgi:DNA polymerase-4